MGISNLIPFVRNACRKGEIEELRGKTVAIDVSCFLHKGLFGCVEQLASGSNSKSYVTYVQRRVQALLDLNCHIILVFDGAPLPAKKTVNDQRKKDRVENMRIGSLLLSQGKKEEAVSKLQKAVSLTREVVEYTIECFHGVNMVDIIVAPYEADAQLAFLLMNNLADVVVTEDSDLIVFGCSQIVFKWDLESKSCVVYDKSRLHLCFTGEMNKSFDFDKFRRICIMSGCDYLQNGLPGVGLSKSYTFFTKTTHKDLQKILPRVPSYLKMPKLLITTAFIQDFIQAEETFLYQIVFDPKLRQQRPLSTHQTEKDLSFAGSIASDEDAVRHSLGNLINGSDALDKFKLPDCVPNWSIWSQESSESSHQVNTEEKKLQIVTEVIQTGVLFSKLEEDNCAMAARNTVKDIKEKSVVEIETDSGAVSLADQPCSYFKRRKSSCSNPFKKPKIELETNIKRAIRSSDISCVENKENIEPIKHQSGFRFSGLRRKPSVT